MSTAYYVTAEDRDRLPDFIRKNGITVEKLSREGVREPYRCTRGEAAVLLTIARVEIPADMADHPARKFIEQTPFEVSLDTESTGWKFWKQSAAKQLLKDIQGLITRLQIK